MIKTNALKMELGNSDDDGKFRNRDNNIIIYNKYL